MAAIPKAITIARSRPVKKVAHPQCRDEDHSGNKYRNAMTMKVKIMKTL